MKSAFEITYRGCRERGVIRFLREVIAHLRDGYVVALPSLFLMARAIELPDGRHAWHVTHAHGDLHTLVNLMPWRLDWIAFDRRGQGRLRVYATDRFLEIALRLPSPAPARDRARNSIRGSLDHEHDHEYEQEVKKL